MFRISLLDFLDGSKLLYESRNIGFGQVWIGKWIEGIGYYIIEISGISSDKGNVENIWKNPD